MDLTEILRDALRQCDAFKIAATRAGAEDRDLMLEIHQHYEQICRLIVRHKNELAGD